VGNQDTSIKLYRVPAAAMSRGGPGLRPSNSNISLARSSSAATAGANSNANGNDSSSANGYVPSDAASDADLMQVS
jgi:hypothetical protein